MIISKDKYWKRVRKEEQSKNLFLIYLDEVCLKSDKGHKLELSEQLANEVVREWSADGKVSAIKIIKTTIKNIITDFCREIFNKFFIFLFLREFFLKNNKIK